MCMDHLYTFFSQNLCNLEKRKIIRAAFLLRQQHYFNTKTFNFFGQRSQNLNRRQRLINRSLQISEFLIQLLVG